MASTYLSKTITPSNYNRRKFTLSAWVKKAEDGSHAYPILGFHGSSDYTMIRVDASSAVEFICYQSSSVVARKQTNMKLRDSFGWYHVVVAVDTDNGTASNRNRIYVNGEEQTSWAIDTNASSGLDLINNNQTNFDIGSGVDQDSNRGYFSGILSHVHYCEGYQYSASDFGETDTTTGEWKIKTSPSVSYGTNGFFILKDGNSGTDQSGNSNNWSVAGGTLTNTEDCPSNVFATWNSLAGTDLPNGGFSNGNTTATQGGNSTWTGAISNLGISSGKFYCEIKWTGQYATFGFLTSSEINLLGEIGQTGKTSYGLYYNGDLFVCENGSNVSVSGYGSAISSGSIVQLAIDKDNNKLYWGINGTWQNSANPSTGTNGRSIAYLTDEFWHFAVDQRKDSGNGTMEANFGNGYFGTTAVSSAGTNASGIGIFEYDVPTGYTALSTKGLNE